MNKNVNKQAIDAALRTARASGGRVHTGAIHSSVAGRTDHLPMNVESGSYVIPADIISAMGEGNSMAGFKVAKSIFGMDDLTGGNPYGESGMPYGVDTPKRAYGGSTGDAHDGVGTSSPSGAGRGAPDGSAGNRSTAMTSSPRPMARPSSTAGSPAAQDYTGLWDRVNGGGPGAGLFSGNNRSGVDQSAAPHGASMRKGSFWNDAKPIIGGMIAGPIGALVGMGLKRNDTGQTGFQRMGDKIGFAGGGSTAGVPIVAAGGEYVIPPKDVLRLGGGDLDHGHKVLDSFVKKMRQKTIKTLQSLPGPKKD